MYFILSLGAMLPRSFVTTWKFLELRFNFTIACIVPSLRGKGGCSSRFGVVSRTLLFSARVVPLSPSAIRIPSDPCRRSRQKVVLPEALVGRAEGTQVVSVVLSLVPVFPHGSLVVMSGGIRWSRRSPRMTNDDNGQFRNRGTVHFSFLNFSNSI